ncbi:MAG: hypothetical protein KF788_01145 [Piscinibacter sp.]|nr:hypothetical protein [Piscinibacter sp.]
MNRPQPHLMLTEQQRRINRQVGAIEWEELPSLAETLARRDAEFERSPMFRTSWDVTLPASLDPLVESGPFVESLRGLETRELREPDVFRHFFA